MAACLLFLSACEDPGSVGNRFMDENAGIETSVFRLSSIDQETLNSYSGRLRYMAIGEYDDQLFGNFQSIGILKPSIDTTVIGSSIDEEDLFQLRIPISSNEYGNTESTARFEVYRVSDPWRGNELFFSDQLGLDQSELLAEFELSGPETVLVDLPQSWIDEFNEYLSYSEEDRNQRYRNEFPGIAIVPADGTSRVFFARTRPNPGEEEDDESLVRFVRTAAEDLDENGENEENGDDEDEEDPRQFQPLSDWGWFGERTPPSSPDEQSLIANSTLDPSARFSTGLTSELDEVTNVANAQLVFHVNRDLLESTLPEGHVRPEVNQLRIHRVISERPGEWIFSRNPDFTATLNQDSDSFRFEISEFVNEILFDSPPAGSFYLSTQTLPGIVFSTALYGDDAADEFRPKILINTVNPDKR